MRKQRQTLPMATKKVPSVTDHFNFLLHVIRKPVAKPENVEPAEGTMSQIPESVALCKSTAWKNMGTLKRIAFNTTPARKLPNMRFARGEFVMMLRGMIGFLAQCSVHRKRGVLMMKTMKAPTTKGWDHG